LHFANPRVHPLRETVGGANLEGANLRGAKLRGANLRGAHWGPSGQGETERDEGAGVRQGGA
ncbi:MAG: pentapeptide repeat-containing protein, partial [Magnetococcales bacterium]|nr:pentapeptide repeat-containing protein [Magnetococcales bacterium]